MFRYNSFNDFYTKNTEEISLNISLQLIVIRTLNVVVFTTVPLYSGNYMYYLMLILLKCTQFPTVSLLYKIQRI